MLEQQNPPAQEAFQNNQEEANNTTDSQQFISFNEKFVENSSQKNYDCQVIQKDEYESDDECLSILQRNLPLVKDDHSQHEGKPQDTTKLSLFEDSKLEEAPKKTCNCTKSNCMRLNCSCFKLQGYCSPECQCKNCLNQVAYSQVRDFVLDKVKFINRAAFREKVTLHKGVYISKRGCKCTKGCQKAYCSCYQNKAQCSSICKCVCCNNDKVYLEKEEVQHIYEYLPRKKYKISIDFDAQQQCKKNKKIYKVSFKNYRNK